MEWVESTGRTVAEAKESALDRLGVHEDDAEFDVLAEARMGLFGRVKEDARVRARVRPTVPRSKDERRRRGRRSGSGDGRSGRGRDRGRSNGSNRNGGKGQSKQSGNGGNERRDGSGGGRSSGSGSREREGSDGRKSKSDKGRKASSSAKAGGRKEESSVNDQDNGPSLMEQAALAEEFVGGLADAFGTSLQFERDELKDGILRIEARGDDIGVLVGRRGSTAQAIDDLVRTVLQRAGGTTREGKIRVDVGGVRARRTASLTEFSQKVAADVIESGQEAVLEPMGGADRKLVHDVIGEIDGVQTRSEGEDPNRRVVIVPASGDA